MSFKTSKHQIKAYYNILNETEGGRPRPPAAEQHGRDEEEEEDEEDGRVGSFGSREGSKNQKGLLPVTGRLELSKGLTGDGPVHRRGDVTLHRMTSSRRSDVQSVRPPARLLRRQVHLHVGAPHPPVSVGRLKPCSAPFKSSHHPPPPPPRGESMIWKSELPLL